MRRTRITWRGQANIVVRSNGAAPRLLTAPGERWPGRRHFDSQDGQRKPSSRDVGRLPQRLTSAAVLYAGPARDNVHPGAWSRPATNIAIHAPGANRGTHGHSEQKRNRAATRGTR